MLCLLNTYHSFLCRDNLKILLEDLNSQKRILKDNGIDVDNKHYQVQFVGSLLILKLLSFRIETTVSVYGLKD